jgi:hypothetical protein
MVELGSRSLRNLLSSKPFDWPTLVPRRLQMPVDFSAPEGAVTPETDGSMFAATPLWDRDAKKHRGRRVVASRSVRDPVIDAGQAGAGAGAIGAATAAEPADAAYETQPVMAGEQVTARRRGVPTGAVAAGVVAIAALAGVGWYASQPHDTGVAQLTPGATTATSEMALNTAAPPSAAQLPVAPPPPPQSEATTHETTTTSTSRPAAAAATPRARDTVAARTPTARVRPAPRDSALEAGVNASTTAPMIATPAPTPSAATAPALDSVPVSPVAPPAPASTAPSVAAPQPSTPAPASDPTATP